MTEKTLTKSLDILDLIRSAVADYRAEFNQDPKQINLGSAAFRRFAVHLPGILPKNDFDGIAVSLNWQIDAEEIVLKD
jgi:hypothetical protein